MENEVSFLAGIIFKTLVYFLAGASTIGSGARSLLLLDPLEAGIVSSSKPPFLDVLKLLPYVRALKMFTRSFPLFETPLPADVIAIFIIRQQL